MRLLRAAIRQPLLTLVALAGAAVAVSFVANLLFMQTGPHPAPLFAKHDASRAPVSEGRSAQGSAQASAQGSAQGSAQASAPRHEEIPPRVVRSVPLAQQVEALPPIPPSAPRSAPSSAPPSIVPAPVKQTSFDPIAQFLKTGVSAAPATTASTNAPPAAETKRIAAAQRALTKLGHALDADGLMGPGTRAAIQKFERENKLPVTGELNPRTLKALSARASIAIP